MHYYQFNIGNYRRDTTHLTMVEHGAYRQLLDQYYMKEEPIPLDMEKVMRTHCARDAVEVSAIEYVLSEYFEKTENGYIHHGCNELISKYNAKSAMAKKSAEARWNKVDDKNKPIDNANALRTDSEGNANHKPLTNNQEPIKTLTSNHFDGFWSAYPKKADKKKCLDKWRKRNLDSIGEKLIADVINKSQNDGQWIDGYAPNPMTYINGDKWDDEIQPLRGSNNEQNRKLTQCEQIDENDRAAKEWLASQGITQSEDGDIMERVINPIR